MRFMHSHWKEDIKKQHRKEVVKMADHYERGAKQQEAQKRELQKNIKKFQDKISEEEIQKADILSKTRQVSLLNNNVELLNDRAGKLRDAYRIKGVLDLATSGDETLGVDGSEWDKHPTLLPCKNGVINLATGELLPPDPNYMMRHASEYKYKGLHEEAPFWTDFLLKVFCYDLEMLDYFERVIGYAVTGLTSHKEIYIAKGPKANNGKSNVFETIKRVVGGYASILGESVLLQTGKKSGGPDPDMLVLDGLRMAIAAEPAQGQKFNKETIKQITGSDHIRARGLYTDTVEFRPICKLFIHTNFMPHIKGADRAFFQRLRIIPFNAQFLKDPKEVDESRHIYQALEGETVKQMYLNESSGILSWIVRCAKKFLIDRSLKPPLKVLHEVEDYKGDMDPVGEWIHDWCEEHPDNPNVKTQAKDLYQSFVCYCKEELALEEQFIISNRKFGDQMQQQFTRGKTNVYYYIGISIRSGFRADERVPTSSK